MTIEILVRTKENKILLALQIQYIPTKDKHAVIEVIT